MEAIENQTLLLTIFNRYRMIGDFPYQWLKEALNLIQVVWQAFSGGVYASDLKNWLVIKVLDNLGTWNSLKPPPNPWAGSAMLCSLYNSIGNNHFQSKLIFRFRSSHFLDFQSIVREADFDEEREKQTKSWIDGNLIKLNESQFEWKFAFKFDNSF